MTQQPVNSTFVGTGRSATFKAAGRFNVTLWGTFVATVKLQRSFDDGVTWVDCSTDGAGTAASYTGPMSVVVDEPSQTGAVIYSLNCTPFTSGTVSYRISQ